MRRMWSRLAGPYDGGEALRQACCCDDVREFDARQSRKDVGPCLGIVGTSAAVRFPGTGGSMTGSDGFRSVPANLRRLSWALGDAGIAADAVFVGDLPPQSGHVHSQVGSAGRWTSRPAIGLRACRCRVRVIGVGTRTSVSATFERAVELVKTGVSSLFAPFNHGAGASAAFFPAPLRNAILQAASDLMLLRLTYHGQQRLVEPYALAFTVRKADGVGQEFRAYDRTRRPGWRSTRHDV